MKSGSRFFSPAVESGFFELISCPPLRPVSAFSMNYHKAPIHRQSVCIFLQNYGDLTQICGESSLPEHYGRPPSLSAVHGRWPIRARQGMFFTRHNSLHLICCLCTRGLPVSLSLSKYSEIILTSYRFFHNYFI